MTRSLRVPAESLRERRRDLWLTARAGRDLVRGLFAFRSTAPAITVFGSARTAPGHPYYALGQAIGRRLIEAGFTVMTGGGPGLMEAVNRGAHEAGGRSIGCRIDLPGEQSHNPFLDRVVSCRHFFTRKVLLFRYSVGFVALPGGFGTLDELFEALTLIQTRKIERFPVVLLGTAYWQPLLELMARMHDERMIDAADLSLVCVVDEADEAVRYIQAQIQDQAPALRTAGRQMPGAGTLSGQDSPSVVMPVA
jgi:uncharacterized protein (TIGR00730 family)